MFINYLYQWLVGAEEHRSTVCKLFNLAGDASYNFATIVLLFISQPEQCYHIIADNYLS